MHERRRRLPRRARREAGDDPACRTPVRGRVVRASVIEAPRVAAVRTVSRPEPGPGQVLLQLEGSGVCASSIPLWEGRTWFDYPQTPGAPGHEGWGRVAAVG